MEDEGNVPVENVGGDIAHVDPSDADSPTVRVGETRDQRRERRLTRAGGTNECGHRALGDRQAHIVKREGRPVGEGHTVNLNIRSVWHGMPRGGQWINREQIHDPQRGRPRDLVGPGSRPQHLDGSRDDEGNERAGDDLDLAHDPGGRERCASRGRDEQDQRGRHAGLPERGAFQQRTAPVAIEAREVLGRPSESLV